MVDRIAVHGSSGSGKSTLARTLAARLDLPVTELDGIFHQPGWTPLPTDEFRAQVDRVAAGERWVVEGNYHQVRDLVWARAQLIVILDLPRWTVMRQVVLRTLRRGVRRAELWNGNRESLRNLVSTDADRNIVLWTWRTLGRFHEEVPAQARTGAPDARVVVLTGHDQADRLVEELAAGGDH